MSKTPMDDEEWEQHREQEERFRQKERREDLRHAYAREVIRAMLRGYYRAHGFSPLPDTKKLALRALYIADRMLEVSDQCPEGTIQPEGI